MACTLDVESFNLATLSSRGGDEKELISVIMPLYILLILFDSESYFLSLNCPLLKLSVLASA